MQHNTTTDKEVYVLSKKKTQRKKILRTESPKERFRKSQEWRDFRTHMAEKFGHKDYITGRKLAKGFNVHHLKTQQEIEGYSDISDDTNFIPLNPYSHKLLHYLFTYYKKDKSIIGRLVEVLDKMCDLGAETQHIVQLSKEDVKEEQA